MNNTLIGVDFRSLNDINSDCFTPEIVVFRVVEAENSRYNLECFDSNLRRSICVERSIEGSRDDRDEEESTSERADLFGSRFIRIFTRKCQNLIDITNPVFEEGLLKRISYDEDVMHFELHETEKIEDPNVTILILSKIHESYRNFSTRMLQEIISKKGNREENGLIQQLEQKNVKLENELEGLNKKMNEEMASLEENYTNLLQEKEKETNIKLKEMESRMISEINRLEKKQLEIEQFLQKSSKEILIKKEKENPIVHLNSVEGFEIEERGSSSLRLGFKKQESSGTWKVVGYKPFLETPRFEFRFKIHDCTSGYVRIGIGTGKHSKTKVLGCDTEAWAYGWGGSGRHNGSGIEIGGIGFTTGDIVGMIVDKVDRKISFLKNGEIIGTPFTNIDLPKRLQICAECYNKSNEFELIYVKEL